MRENLLTFLKYYDLYLDAMIDLSEAPIEFVELMKKFKSERKTYSEEERINQAQKNVMLIILVLLIPHQKQVEIY